MNFLLSFIVPSLVYYSNTITNFFLNYQNGYFITQTKKEYNTTGILKKTNLVIVAHPDDEILWFGDFIKNNSSTTKVLCITNASNEIRSAEFIQTMNKLNVSYEMWDYIDDKKYLGSIELENKLKNICNKFDNIYTHSACGETGHPQHIMLHDYIYFLAKEKLYIFSPKPILHKELTDIKKELLTIYSSQKKVIDKHIYLSARENHNKMI